MISLQQLKTCAVAWSLFPPTTLKRAVDRLGFVQADPIRSPARAQDLILRHRVKGYRSGDLERRYTSLDLEEDFLYVYGFFPRQVSQLLTVRSKEDLSEFELKVLEKVRSSATTHPRDLDIHFGRERIVNDWGGFSQATKRALERLHHRGFLRVARRDKGIRIYAPVSESRTSEPPSERFRKLILLVVNLLAPVAERTLSGIAARLRRWIPDVADHKTVLRDLARTGELERHSVENLVYYWPGGRRLSGEAPRQVRILSPFDPVVWDRLRFEHLWGWAYRFEAYTPAAKRIRGYYAMPLLSGADVIGWANASVVDDNLKIKLGFVGKQPKDRQFSLETEAEIERLKIFLNLRTAEI